MIQRNKTTDEPHRLVPEHKATWIVPLMGAIALALAILVLLRFGNPDGQDTGAVIPADFDQAIPVTVSRPAVAARPAVHTGAAVPYSAARAGMPRVHGEAEWNFARPEAGDPDWEDYREMLRTLYRSSVENSAGFDVPYDPEWRAELTGRREAPLHDLGLLGGAGSVEQLVEFMVIALEAGDKDMLRDLRLKREEFLYVFWPEMPRSRPFLRIPPDEAWSFHYASSRKGMQETVEQFGGRHLEIRNIRLGEVREFTNFRILRDVVITLKDIDTGETLEMHHSITECKGKFKVYMYAV